MKDERKIKTLIIPDVHGRSFWKEPIEEVLSNTNAKIVFLGDYHDPYSDDFVNPLTGMSNFDYHKLSLDRFKEIIGLKKLYPDRIILLLGNHDCSYAVGPRICDCRRDRANSGEIEKLFNDTELFQLAYEQTINKKHFIFSHAGISKQYAECCFGENINEKNVVKKFNNAWKKQTYGILDSLGYYDMYRGWGGLSYGSLVWADAREWINKTQEGYGITVVGHTQLNEALSFEDKYYMLDARECFYINTKGEVKNYLTGENIKAYESLKR